MAPHESTHLPIHPAQTGESQSGTSPTCSSKIYVSSEEASILRELRAVRERAIALRGQLATAEPALQRQLEETIGELRALRGELVHRREAAFRRKMVMLGHLPAGVLVDDEIE